MSGTVLFPRQPLIRFVGAFLLGAGVLVILVLVLSILGKLTLFNLFLSFFFFLGILGVLNKKLLFMGSHHVGTFFIFALITGLLSWLFSSVNFSILSYDSYRMIEIGLDIGWDGGLSRSTTSKLAAWGVFIPSIQAIGALFGIDYLYGFQPLLVLSFAATWFYFLWLEYDQKGYHIFKISYVGLATLSFFSTYFVFFQAGYIHNSMIAAAYLFLLVSSSKLEIEGKISATTVYFVALCFSLCRAEGPIAVLLVFAVWQAHKKIVPRDVVFYFLIFALPVTAWYSYMIIDMGKSGDILTPDRVFIILSILFLYGLGILVTLYSEKCCTVFKWLGKHIISLLMLSLAMIITFKFENTIESISATYQNMTETGRWGYFWYCTAAATALSLFKFKRQPLNLFLLVGLASLLFIIDISFTRIPYRLGFGDSGNRMLTHVAPLLWFYATAVLVSRTSKEKKSFRFKSFTVRKPKSMFRQLESTC